MKNVPKITIVTPSYNQARFLEKTILSILDQNYPNLEYIVMDGGSTDDSVEIIKKYEKHLHCWTSGKDGGQSAAINRGFEMSTGDILGWINSDDRLKPGALKAVVEMAHSHPDAGAWVGGCDLVDADGKRIQTVRPRGLTRDRIADWGVTGHFFQPACFLSRKGWEKYGPLDERIYTCFDLDLYLKIIADYPFYGTEAVWAEATIHKDAKTQARIPLMRAEISVVQVRHGYEDLAVKNIEKAETAAMTAEPLMKFLRWPGRLMARFRRMAAIRKSSPDPSGRREHS